MEGVSEDFSELLQKLKSVQTTIRELTTVASQLEKRVQKASRVLKKQANKKQRRNNSSGSPSGFTKPGQVSDELRTFLKLDKDQLIARTDVTKMINNYCKEYKLQDEKDRRILLPDKKLTKLLRLKKGDELTFFNLQKYMKVHFPNKDGVYPTA